MLDQPVWRYLPKDFDPYASFKELTFRQLLSHTSGIHVGVDKYRSMQAYVNSHPDVSDKKSFYSNTNFALFRLLVPNLVNRSPLNFDDLPVGYAAAFKAYVQKNVLDPVGLRDIPSATDKTSGLNYRFPPPSDSSYRGFDLGDLTLQLGSHGWVMSTREFAAFTTGLNHTEKIVRKELSDQMKNACLGYDYGDWGSDDSRCRRTVAVNYFFWEKSGWYPGCGDYWFDAFDGNFRSELVVFSNDVSIALFVNSNLKDDNCWSGGGTSPLNSILDAFNRALEN